MTQCDVGLCTREARWYNPLLENVYCEDCAEYLTARFDVHISLEQL